MPIFVDIYARVHGRTLRDETDRVIKRFDDTGTQAAGKFSDSFEREMARSSPKIQRSFHAAANATESADRAMRDYMRTMSSANASVESQTRATEDLDRAKRAEADAHRSAASAIKDYDKEAEKAHRNTHRFSNDMQSLAGSMLGIRAAGPLGAAALGVIGLAAIDVAKFAVTASQSIGLIPAAAATAAAGVGTLKLATMGFGQAMKDIGDPEKFATDLAALAPAAQQTALEIRNLLPELKGLQQATQDTFFKGFAEQFHNLTDTFLPSVKELTTGIADSFNQMVMQVSGDFMKPENVTQIQQIFSNINGFFKELVPSAQSFSQALLDITSVGSSFLPGLGSSISDAAANFASFIREARDSGKLKEWISDGIDAVKMLAGEIKDLVVTIYETFGRDGPKNIETFKSNLEGLGRLIAAMSGDFDPLVKRWHDKLQEAADDSGSLGSKIGQALSIPIENAINDINHMINALVHTVNAGIRGVNAISPFTDIPTIETDAFLNSAMPGTGSLPTTPAPPAPGQAPLTPAAILGAATAGPGGVPVTGPVLGGVPLGTPLPPKPSPGAHPGVTAGLPPYAPSAVPAAPATGPGESQSDVLNRIRSNLDPNSYKVDPFAGMPGVATTGGATASSAYAPSAMVPGVSAGNPQVAPPDENTIRSWVEANFGIPNSLGTGSWENATHDYSGGTWHHKGLGGATVPSGYGFDFHGSQAQMAGLANWIAQNAAGQTLELIYSGAGFDTSKEIKNGKFGDVYGAATNAQHGDHVHWAVAGMPGMGGVPTSQGTLNGGTGMGYNALGQPTGMGGYVQDPQKIADARDRVESEAHDYEEAKKDRLALEQSNLASAEEISDAKYKEQEAEKAWHKAQRELVDATTGTWKEMEKSGKDLSTGMGQIGAAIDQDFGISKGLPGLAENLVKFIGSLAAAPIVGPMNAMIAANEKATGIQGGHGLLGMLSAQNIGRTGNPLGIAGGANSLLGHLANWDAIAGPESGGNWGINTGNGFSGGLQFTPSSWAAAGGTQYAPSANLATPEQQKTVADNLLRMQGPGAWPATSAAHPDWFNPPGPTDTQPAMLSPGEMVVPSSLTPQVAGMLGIRGYAGGGIVGQPQYGGVEPYSNPAGGNAGYTSGGGIDMAISAAATAADLFAPGAGQAVQIGAKLINRAIQYAGQVAGIGVSGLMETFLPTGGSELANNNWLTRIAGGIAGASPALANVAGSLGQQQAQQGTAPNGIMSAAPPLTPEQALAQGGPPGPRGPAPGPTIGNMVINSQAPTSHGMANDVAAQQRAMYGGNGISTAPANMATSR